MYPSIWKTLRAYLSERRGTALAVLMVYAVFFCIGALSALDPAPLVYAAILSSCIGAVLLAAGFPRYLRRSAALDAVRRRSPEACLDFPDAVTLPERDYQEIARAYRDAYDQSRREAERARAEANRYYGLWAHQIKTPIAAMRLLIQDQTREVSRDDLLLELFKIEQYVDMALQYLRLGAGARDLVLSKCPLDAIIRQAVKKTSALFIHKRIALELEASGVDVCTDEKWMVFVLEQILTNAVKYTPVGKVRVAPARDIPNTLVVEDTGIGIRPEDLPRLFEWGFTGYNGRLDPRSTGIGLYLCRQVAGLLGHTLRVESDPGRGTRVYIGFGREDIRWD